MRVRRLFQRFGCGFEIDFRFTRAGDAIEQRDVELALTHRGAEFFRRSELDGGEVLTGEREVRVREWRVFADFELHQRAAIDEAFDDGRRCFGAAREFGGADLLLRRFFHDAAAGVCEFRRLLTARCDHRVSRRREERLGRAHDHAREIARRADDIFRRPLDEGAADFRHRRAGQHFFDGFQVRGAGMIALDAPDNAAHKARADRRDDMLARLDLQRRRRAVIEWLGQRQREEHRDLILRVGFVLAALLRHGEQRAERGRAALALQRFQGAAAGG